MINAYLTNLFYVDIPQAHLTRLLHPRQKQLKSIRILVLYSILRPQLEISTSRLGTKALIAASFYPICAVIPEPS